MHAKKKLIRWPYALVAWVMAMGALGLFPASASTTVDVAGQALSFNSGKYFDGTSLGAQQNQSDGSGSPDIGVNAEVGDYVNFYNVITVGGTQVDARMTFLAENDLVGDNDVPDQVEEMDEADSTAGYNSFIITGLDFENGTGDSWGEFKIEFFEDIEGAATPLTLQNVRLSTYDIDATQYAEFSGFDRYYLSTDSVLQVTTPRTGITRFAEVDGNPSNNQTEEQTKLRVTVEFDSLSSFTYRIGKFNPDSQNPNTGSGTWYLDFSSGLDWNGTQGAAVVSPAKVTSVPVPATYEGPLGLRQQASNPCVGGTVLVTGQRIDSIKDVLVAGVSVPFEILENGNLRYSLGNTAAGKHQVKFWVPVNSVYLTDSITVASCTTLAAEEPAAETGTPFFAKKLFANYRGDRGGVVAQDLSAISAFINQYSGIQKVTCVGSTSGVPAISTDPALAQARAKNACDIVKTLVPDAEFTLKTSTGKGVGQRFRSVTVFIAGNN